MFKGNCFSSEGYVACCDIDQSRVLKAITWSNIRLAYLMFGATGNSTVWWEVPMHFSENRHLRNGNVLGTV